MYINSAQLGNALKVFIAIEGWDATVELLQTIIQPQVGRHVMNCQDWFAELNKVLVEKPPHI